MLLLFLLKLAREDSLLARSIRLACSYHFNMCSSLVSNSNLILVTLLLLIWDVSLNNLSI